MKVQKAFWILFLSSIIYVNYLNAQTTIGSDEAPVSGALLQLKNIRGVTDGSPNATKGLGLPRIQLSKTDDLSDLLPANAMTGNYKADHAGLMVYNITEGCANGHPFDPGIFIWDSESWIKVRPETIDPLENETATSLTDREGNIYTIADFGPDAGVWMTQNLRTKTAPGGIPLYNHILPAPNQVSRKRNFIYPGPGNGAVIDGTDATTFNAHPEYGLLYNWFAATNNENCITTDQGQKVGQTPGANEVENTHRYIQGICPKGWHLPSDREWNLLEKEMTENANLYSSVTPSTWDPAWETLEGNRGSHGKVMKSPNKVINIDNDNDTAGESFSYTSSNPGFDLYLTSGANQYSTNGLFKAFGNIAYLWTSSAKTGSQAWIRTFYSTIHSTGTRHTVARSATLSDMMFAVRCKKD